MARIQLPAGIPDIRGPMVFRPIASACMYNLYVDELAPRALTGFAMHLENGKRLADHGHLVSTSKLVAV